MFTDINYVLAAIGAAFVFVNGLTLVMQIIIDKRVEKEIARMPKTYYHYNISWASKISPERGEVEFISSHKLRDWFMMKEVGKRLEMTMDMFAINNYTESEELTLENLEVFYE